MFCCMSWFSIIFVNSSTIIDLWRRFHVDFFLNVYKIRFSSSSEIDRNIKVDPTLPWLDAWEMRGRNDQILEKYKSRKLFWRIP